MNKLIREFISDEHREYKFKFGQLLASSLSGFITGAIVASLVWVVVLNYVSNLRY